VLTSAAKTALYGAHVSLGAKMSPFGGFLMPIVYTSILDEHKAVRTAAGLFDLSHMGQLVARGPGVAEWLDRLTVNRVVGMREGQARYNIFTNERGGAHDDAILYRFPDEWLIVVNAANTAKMWELLQASQPAQVALENRTPQSALIAIQGPRAAEILAPLCGADLDGLRSYHALRTRLADGAGGVEVEIARTGYTGEDGFEIFLPASAAAALWERLLAAGAARGLRPAGLGARDVLRLEAGMPLYGHELDEEITPLQAGLGWAVRWEKPDFIGKAALAAQKAADDYDRIVGVVMDGKAPARAGYAVYADGRRVGEVRSGSVAPALGGRNIATALVAKAASAPGTRLTIEIRGTAHPATVVPLPFYKRPA
jgi:aminomethyltransferase